MASDDNVSVVVCFALQSVNAKKKMFFSLIKEFFLVERRCRGGHGKISWHTTHNLFSSDIKD